MQDAEPDAEAWVRTCAGHNGGGDEDRNDDGDAGVHGGAHGKEEAHARREEAGMDAPQRAYRLIS